MKWLYYNLFLALYHVQFVLRKLPEGVPTLLDLPQYKQTLTFSCTGNTSSIKKCAHMWKLQYKKSNERRLFYLTLIVL